MKFTQWPKRDPIKNCFLFPNKLFSLGLESGEIAVYSYLLRCENRKTHQCWPSYQTIGGAVGLSKKTVQKYVAMLENKHLIKTEPTTVRRGRTDASRTATCCTPSVRSKRRWLISINSNYIRWN